MVGRYVVSSNSYFVRHNPCPKCGSRDNLAEFSDGHSYCFGCGFVFFGDDSSRVYNYISSSNGGVGVSTGREISLPDDVDSYIPAVARFWLGNYGIKETEVIHNRLLWSEKKAYLVFPYFDKYGNLVSWQGRYFGDNPDHPKWIGKGNLKTLYHILPPRDSYDRIVVVEDIISAIKVGRSCPCMPLFGSQIGLERLIRLSKLTDRITLWLDYDKRSYAVSESSKSLVDCDVIITDLDPKEYLDEQIKEILDK
jgi:ribosomal protein S27AE